jgi:putative pyruvate formate lyase activating enzyme
VENYPEINQAAVKEMHRQVGDLVTDERGIAQRGLLVRHLVLPEGLAGTAFIARFLAQEASRDTYINIMDQYRPCYRAMNMPPLDRRVTSTEYAEAVQQAREAGLHRFDRREPRFLHIFR